MGGNIICKSGTNGLVKCSQNTICYGAKLEFLRLFCAPRNSEKKLEKFEKMKAKSTHIKWIDSFKKPGCKFEHEAFLVSWLSRGKRSLPKGRKYFRNQEQILVLNMETEAPKISGQALNEQHIKVEEEDEDNYPDSLSPRVKAYQNLSLCAKIAHDLQESLSKGQRVPKCLTMYQNNRNDLLECLSKDQMSSCRNQIIDLNRHPDSPLETQTIEPEIDQENRAKGRNTLLGLTPGEAIAMRDITSLRILYGSFGYLSANGGHWPSYCIGGFPKILYNVPCKRTYYYVIY
ncbi:hypothetical protein M9H77_00048 [Catharanthus roseus]|nr:hypothetical protein M9H77_00048 [Catharanthus roseus]